MYTLTAQLNTGKSIRTWSHQIVDLCRIALCNNAINFSVKEFDDLIIDGTPDMKRFKVCTSLSCGKARPISLYEVYAHTESQAVDLVESGRIAPTLYLTRYEVPVFTVAFET